MASVAQSEKRKRDTKDEISIKKQKSASVILKKNEDKENQNRSTLSTTEPKKLLAKVKEAKATTAKAVPKSTISDKAAVTKTVVPVPKRVATLKEEDLADYLKRKQERAARLLGSKPKTDKKTTTTTIETEKDRLERLKREREERIKSKSTVKTTNLGQSLKRKVVVEEAPLNAEHESEEEVETEIFAKKKPKTDS